MRSHRLLGACALAAATLVATDIGAHETDSVCFRQKNLVSNSREFDARFTDRKLVNAWGITSFLGDLLWVASNEESLVNVYEPDGRPVRIGGERFRISVPDGAPTGLAHNATRGFRVPGPIRVPSLLLIASENGTISAWNPVNLTTAVTVIDNMTTPQTASYKGVAIGSTRSRSFLYAANFLSGEVERYNEDFSLAGTFTDDCRESSDPCVPGIGIGADRNQDWAPFNVTVIGNRVIVAFALREAVVGGIDEEQGPGFGFIDSWDLFGSDRSFRRLVTGGPLNAPWGLVRAPGSFAPFGGDLLVGNFGGEGRINAFDLDSGAFRGPLLACDHGARSPVAIDGLWGLTFLQFPGRSAPSLYFAAGPNDEADGLVGKLRPEH